MKRAEWRRRLLSSTRGKILALLRNEDGTVSELAASLNLTENAVRAHLLSLERDGLVQQRGTRPGTRRPHAAYGLTAEVEHIFPKAYAPLLNQLLTIISKRMSSRAVAETMREVGHAMAKDQLRQLKVRTRAARIDAALKLFNDLGGSAVFEKSEGKQLIHGRNGCPLAAVTASHPEACLIIESLLSDILGVPVKKCCADEETPHCCFEIG
ncbi:MAG TPA: ArsR family transcriptional regulator [Chthoniobacterales bacterium]|nr:ArsR family transcriptional regulator [Chthoniobacterales bacterium]